jgi:transcriptional regulator with XRE-family HTH domain
MLGSRLRQIREQKGLTIPQVAKRAKLSFSFVSEIETNKKTPRERTVKAISAALGLKHDELEEVKIDARLEEIGMTQPEFTMMFKEIAIGRMTLAEKRKILDAYELIKYQRQKQNGHKRCGNLSRPEWNFLGFTAFLQAY